MDYTFEKRLFFLQRTNKKCFLALYATLAAFSLLFLITTALVIQMLTTKVDCQLGVGDNKQVDLLFFFSAFISFHLLDAATHILETVPLSNQNQPSKLWTILPIITSIVGIALFVYANIIIFRDLENCKHPTTKDHRFVYLWAFIELGYLYLQVLISVIITYFTL